MYIEVIRFCSCLYHTDISHIGKISHHGYFLVFVCFFVNNLVNKTNTRITMYTLAGKIVFGLFAQWCIGSCLSIHKQEKIVGAK